jgi:hypothetical protein
MLQTQSRLQGQTNSFSIFLGLLVAISLSQSVAAAPLISNGNFNTASSTGSTSLTTDDNGGIGPSAAKSWQVLNDNAGTTTTELLPSPNIAGGKMIHVVTTNIFSGIFQSLPKQPVDPTKVYTCVWIYINSGAVGVGSGLDAATQIDATLYKTGSWEVLNVGNISSPATLTNIYAQTPLFPDAGYNGGADFYIESAQVSTSQAQCKRT